MLNRSRQKRGAPCSRIAIARMVFSAPLCSSSPKANCAATVSAGSSRFPCRITTCHPFAVLSKRIQLGFRPMILNPA
jgi:hypothetical protein